MIDPECLTATWQEKARKELGAHEDIFDRTVFAFHLLNHLSASGLNFTFKGGTCLLLLQPGFRRLSIDIDIHTATPKGELEACLERIVAQGAFKSMTRGGQGEHPQRTRYRFKYWSEVMQDQREILLDAVHDSGPINIMTEVDAAPKFLPQKERHRVRIPTLHSILGDKLTAFAPNTIGVPWERGGKSKETQIAKQLFDIHQLIDGVTDPEQVASSYLTVLEAQNRYLGKKYTHKDVAQDTLDIALACSKRETRGDVTTLDRACGNFGTYLVRGNEFTHPQSRYALARAAAWALWCSNPKRSKISPPMGIPYDATEWTKQLLPDKKLDDLKQTSPEAYGYWLYMHQQGLL